ncbi:hypothetical protein [Hymenobacter koreensis]|uniref:Lipoprotein n=1 Tax=Hymenobacter koreensis TaxID=1084523 RepID=A0ABP8IZ69_9BACT
MKSIVYFIPLSLFLIGSSACSRSGDATMANPRSYGSVKVKPQQRANDKSRFKEQREKNNGTFGLGLADQSNNPYKFQTVKAPKKYKYSKPKGY